jgi:hypothetical protein
LGTEKGDRPVRRRWLVASFPAFRRPAGRAACVHASVSTRGMEMDHRAAYHARIMPCASVRNVTSRYVLGECMGCARPLFGDRLAGHEEKWPCRRRPQFTGHSTYVVVRVHSPARTRTRTPALLCVVTLHCWYNSCVACVCAPAS